MLEQKDGWFVVNVKDARWRGSPEFGMAANFRGRRINAQEFGRNVQRLRIERQFESFGTRMVDDFIWWTHCLQI